MQPVPAFFSGTGCAIVAHWRHVHPGCFLQSDWPTSSNALDEATAMESQTSVTVT